MRRTPLLLSLLLAACGTSSPPGSDTGGTGEFGTPDDPSPLPASKGAYKLTSTIDLTVEAVLPAQVEAVVATLREFQTNPAHALIDAASRAGVPAVGAIYGALPSALTDPLEGWINGEFAKVQIAGQPVTAFAGDVVGLVDTALSTFDVDSTLAIDPASATAVHTLNAIDLTPTGLDVTIPISGLAADILSQTPTISLGSAGALAIGDQHFGLEYGEYAWQAVEHICTQQFGSDIRGELGKAINCGAVAHAIASKCVLTVCVGHQAELTSLCSAGLDAVVNAAHAELASLRIDVFHYAHGTATLVDDDRDGVADRITDGTWQAEMNLGLGLRHTPATFVGTR